MKTTYCVYMHTNQQNNKKYIGITCQRPEYRWSAGAGYKTQIKFYNAIKKYGWESFTHEILFEDLTETEAKEKEIELIAKYKTVDANFGYNCTLGGEGRLKYKTVDERRTASNKYHKAHAIAKYAKIKEENGASYAKVLKNARERAKQRQEDPIEHEKILAARKRCKQKAMQDPEKKAKILEANKAAKEKVKTLRQELLTLYDKYPNLFMPEELEIAFTKFSKDSGCFKYNSAKQLNEILNSILRRLNNG